ncbi:hypothetical protein NL676_010069 [Syzygium grande]|nr:hypothetical protein NL676_010069 [Syzygium grande]
MNILRNYLSLCLSVASGACINKSSPKADELVVVMEAWDNLSTDHTQALALALNFRFPYVHRSPNSTSCHCEQHPAPQPSARPILVRRAFNAVPGTPCELRLCQRLDNLCLRSSGDTPNNFPTLLSEAPKPSTVALPFAARP